MRGLPLWLVLAVLWYPSGSTEAASAPGAGSAVDCEALGFSSLALCSDCEVLAEFVQDEDLLAECRQCCAEESKPKDTKYASAVLEVCRMRLSSYPHVEGFLSRAGEYGGRLKVKNRYGAYPQLLMKKANGKTGTTVRVDNWKAEDFEEFLASKLEPEGEAPVDAQGPDL